MAFKMNSPFKIEEEEEVEIPKQTDEWVDTEWLSRIYNSEKNKYELEKMGYDWDTLGTNKKFPYRVYKKKQDVKFIQGKIRPTRAE